MAVKEKVLRAVRDAKICIVVSCYNADIVNRLIKQALMAFCKEQSNINTKMVIFDREHKLTAKEWEQAREWIKTEVREQFIEEAQEKGVFLAQVSLENNTIEAMMDEELLICYVPGAFEIPQAARLIASRGLCDAIVALGCAIRGETKHFDAIASACTDGLNRVAQDFTMPVAHGVLLVEDKEQAEARTQDDKNRGGEAVKAVFQMLRLQAEVDLADPAQKDE